MTQKSTNRETCLKYEGHVWRELTNLQTRFPMHDYRVKIRRNSRTFDIRWFRRIFIEREDQLRNWCLQCLARQSFSFPLWSIVSFMNPSFPPPLLLRQARWAEAKFNSQRPIAISRGEKGAETCALVTSRARSMRHKRLIYLTYPRRCPPAGRTKERRVTTLSVSSFRTNYSERVNF